MTASSKNQQSSYSCYSDSMSAKFAIDLPELAESYGANPRSVRNTFYLRPEDFPPAIYLPGSRGPRFLVSDVLFWLTTRKNSPVAPQPQHTPKQQQPKGRPRKASPIQITRARRLMRKDGAA